MSTARYLTVVIPIAQEDVFQTSKKFKQQFLTRVLYNAYLPFEYSFILDTHVYPCYNDSYSKIFSLFKESNTDIAASNRVGNFLQVFGAAVLSKWGAASHLYWKEVYYWMLHNKWLCDQKPMRIHASKASIWKYRWLSSNWVFASHGIDANGKFEGYAGCYRSSVIATGPIMWIHGSPEECQLMNGHNNQLSFKNRTYFKSGSCNMPRNGPMVVEYLEDLRKLVAPQKPPILLNWHKKRDALALFWEY